MNNGIVCIGEKELESNQANGRKRTKQHNESGIIVEYIKALGDWDLNNLRMLLNIFSGCCISKDWKEIRLVLVHKGGSRKELKNYRPVSIINVVCKLIIMLLREIINGWMEESGMIGDIQGRFLKGLKDRE